MNSNEVKIEYCPTGDMLADYFTKPLQGSAFQKFRNLIMNYYMNDPIPSVTQDPRSVLGNKDANEGKDNPKDTKDTGSKESGPDWTTVTHKRHSHKTALKAPSKKGTKVSGSTHLK